MSPTTWISALMLGALPVLTHAEPLATFTASSGQISALESEYWNFGRLQVGMPISVQFDFEVNTSYSKVEPGVFMMEAQGFYTFNLTANGVDQYFTPNYTGPRTRITLRDNATNAAGEVVDVLDLSAEVGDVSIERYRMATHLEFGATTFNGLDAWSILGLEDAPLRAGTFHLDYYRRREDPPPVSFYNGLDANLGNVDVRFYGPGTEVPSVPEPGAPAMLLAGLAGTALVRRCTSRNQAKVHHA